MEPSPNIIVKTIRSCKVCGTEPARSRYGILSCGACALFFRRSVNSNSFIGACECYKKGTRYICKFCRMNKCLEAGMKKSMVSISNQQSTTCNRLPVLPIMKINDNIIERSTDQLKSVRVRQKLFNVQREFFDAINGSVDRWNYFDLTCIFSRDFRKMRKFYEDILTGLRNLTDLEKDVLFTNFFPVYNVFELTVFPVKSSDHFLVMNKPSLDRFYERSNEKFSLAEDGLSRIFAPFWEHFNTHFRKPVLELKLDYIEIAFITSYRLLDIDSPRLSDASLELCRALKKIVLRELRSYYIEIGIEEKRLYDVLEIPIIMEKTHAKLYDEFIVSETYGVRMDEGYRRIMSIPKL